MTKISFKCILCDSTANYRDTYIDGPHDYFCSIEHYKINKDYLNAKGLIWRGLGLHDLNGNKVNPQIITVDFEKLLNGKSKQDAGELLFDFILCALENYYPEPSHGQEGHAGLCWGCDIPIGDVLIDDLAALYSRNNIDMLAELRKRGLNK